MFKKYKSISLIVRIMIGIVIGAILGLTVLHGQQSTFWVICSSAH